MVTLEALPRTVTPDHWSVETMLVHGNTRGITRTVAPDHWPVEITMVHGNTRGIT